jgi:hypothetical protein
MATVTLKFNPFTGGATPLTVLYPVLSSGEATAKSVVLPFAPSTPGQTMLDVIGGGAQVYGDDFSVSGSTLTWAGLGLDGLLAAGDQVRIVLLG